MEKRLGMIGEGQPTLRQVQIVLCRYPLVLYTGFVLDETKMYINEKIQN